ncbi:hypothetical protein Q0590_26285 [Rhodocytophaga aerolata]|uniref:Uncharacterized protein n=1 Tax=Rhodocytophaga aerolata TaxID=455078 RepID=A0ABT8RG90_9BACT|nr:hypothetical protein [Rhodocytophaga aerolata]MDO1449815.1 hypothetical protein [Rhodocytophaga aerolata]
MTRKTIIKILIATLILALITNYTPIKGILELEKVYFYSTFNGELQTAERPFKGCNYSCVEMVLQEFKHNHPGASDTILYRTFKRNPLLIWRWHDYLFHPRYKLPYLHPEQVKRTAS